MLALPNALKNWKTKIEENTRLTVLDIHEHWRYIRYKDGTEELYHMSDDPDQFTNLAADPKLATTKSALARWLPKQDAPLLKVPGGKRSKE